ncbi:MAG: hypothetical protein KF891_04520 [Rhizobacter sp.]|nr:hypothetical protein [Rhizobacter sp.]
MSAVPHTTEAEPRSPVRNLRLAGDALLYGTLAALVLGAWFVSRQGYFTAGDDVGYWLGVAGGLMMLTLFTYPLRKHFRFMHRLGKVKWWLVMHMVLGIAGPLLILVHSTFRVGSLNAGVALYSMIIVALSGVVGRFIYMRVNRGLHGEQTTLRELQVRAGLDQSETRSRLHFAPEVEARLQDFELRELKAQANWATFARQVTLLPLQQWRVYRACVADLREPLQRMAELRQWTPEERAKRERRARKLVRRYLHNVVRVAQFTAYERLFALWHVAHVPFVYLLILSAAFHVFAVHAY